MMHFDDATTVDYMILAGSFYLALIAVCLVQDVADSVRRMKNKKHNKFKGENK